MNISARNEEVFLALGSNLGNRESHLQNAIQLINEEIGSVVSLSQIYETEPLVAPGSLQNADLLHYYNAVLCCISSIEPVALLEIIHDIESRLGRQRNDKWGSRTIDIDIIAIGTRCFISEDLMIPHPEMHLRDFVLKPVMDIAPQFVHPVLNASVSELHLKLRRRFIVKTLPVPEQISHYLARMIHQTPAKDADLREPTANSQVIS